MDGYDLKYFADVCYKTKWRFIAWGVEEIPESLSPKNDKLILESKCAEWWFKKSRFVKEQKARGLLSNLGIKTSLSKILLLNVLFWMQFHWVHNINAIVKKTFTGRW